MAPTSFSTSIRYVSDGHTALWPIPFPFGAPSDVGVKLVDAEGRERRLTHGTDCLVGRDCVTAVVPAGTSLVIWLDVPVEEALERARARAARPPVPGPVYPGPAVPPPPPPPPGPHPEVLRLAAQVAELQRDRDAALIAARAAEADAQVQRLKDEGQAQADTLSRDVTARLEAAAREHLVRLEKEAAGLAETAAEARNQAAAALKNASEAREQLAQAVAQARHEAVENVTAAASLGSTTNLEGYFEQGTDRAAGDVLHLPAGLLYYPGRAMLRVVYQGTTLSCGKHFEEVGEADVPSDGIRPLFASRAGDQWGFWVVASNVGAVAEAAAGRAERARDEAADAAAEAGKAADKAGADADQASDAADKAGLWSGVAEDMADEAHRLARCAWKAAYQASVSAARPGIAAVRDLDELAHCVSGVYVIIPQLTHAPTPFMGLWPVAGIEETLWDGVFFFGPPYPDHPTPPPVPCDPPRKPDAETPDTGTGGSTGAGNTGTGSVWKPCGRT